MTDPLVSTASKIPRAQVLVDPPRPNSDSGVQRMYPGKFGDDSRATSGTYRTPAGAPGTLNPCCQVGCGKPAWHTPPAVSVKQLLAPPPAMEIQISLCTCAAVAVDVSATQPVVPPPVLQNVSWVAGA